MKNIITPILNCYSNQRKVNELSKELERQIMIKKSKERKVKNLIKDKQSLKRRLYITNLRLNTLINKVDLKTLIDKTDIDINSLL
jgi:hypothetical protein